MHNHYSFIFISLIYSLFSAFALNKWLSSPSGVGQHVPTLVFGEYQGRGVSDWYQSVVLFRAYLGFSLNLVMYLSWRHFDVTTSKFRNIQLSCANLFLLELSPSGWNTRIRVGIVPQWWHVWLVVRLSTSDRYFATYIPWEWWAESVLLGCDVFRMLSWGSLIKASCRSELAIPLCNMSSLGIAGGVSSILKSWETENLGDVSWLRPTRNLKQWYHSTTCVPHKWRAEPCLSGNYSKLSKCM